jgi:hypothetical protein
MQRLGRPMIGDDPATALVLAMGKFGGRELNYRSDLDIIFLYDHDGGSVPLHPEARGQGPTSNAHFFAELSQRTMKACNTLTPQGRLYEVDSRLRPSGRSGAAAVSLDELARWFAPDGPAAVWERQALLKARPVIGAEPARRRFAAIRAAAIWGRSWSAADVAEIRHNRLRMEQGATAANLKRGPGGVVDIEFLVQVLQLVHGATDPRLQTTETLAGLVADKQLAPRGRSLAFGWLEARDPARAAVLLGGMLDEEALDLRRAAVAKLLADAAAGDAAAQAASHRQALAAARDVDQVEAIATWLTEHGEPTDVAGALGFVRQWKVSGEYDNVGGVGFAKAYPPEEGGAVPAGADWKPFLSSHKHGEIDLNAAVATKKGVLAYAVAEVELPAAGRAEVRIGSPCAVAVWVNGRQVMAHEIYHASEAIDQYVAATEFRQGANTVLVKCCQNEQTEPWAGEWKFQLRITDPLGKPLATQRAEDPK